MDLTSSIIPKSDQLNADDLMAGPVTVTIKDVTAGSAEQPININLVEFPGRAYRPSKSMRRVMVMAWSAEASGYAGHQLTLTRNPEIMFGGVKVGGIEIAALSHIDKPLTIALTSTRGKRKDFTVQPLVTRDWLAELERAGDNATTINALGKSASDARVAPAILAKISARYNELKAPVA